MLKIAGQEHPNRHRPTAGIKQWMAPAVDKKLNQLFHTQIHQVMSPGGRYEFHSPLVSRRHLPDPARPRGSTSSPQGCDRSIIRLDATTEQHRSCSEIRKHGSPLSTCLEQLSGAIWNIATMTRAVFSIHGAFSTITRDPAHPSLLREYVGIADGYIGHLMTQFAVRMYRLIGRLCTVKG